MAIQSQTSVLNKCNTAYWPVNSFDKKSMLNNIDG